MTKEIQYITSAKTGMEIPKYYRDFKSIIDDDNAFAENLSMNYEDMEKDDLGAQLELVSQSLAWIVELLESRELVYRPNAGRRKQVKDAGSQKNKM